MGGDYSTSVTSLGGSLGELPVLLKQNDKGKFLLVVLLMFAHSANISTVIKVIFFLSLIL